MCSASDHPASVDSSACGEQYRAVVSRSWQAQAVLSSRSGAVLATGKVASIEYGDLKVASASTRFIEESVQTSDSQQVGNTWRYVRKTVVWTAASTTIDSSRSCFMVSSIPHPLVD